MVFPLFILLFGLAAVAIFALMAFIGILHLTWKALLAGVLVLPLGAVLFLISVLLIRGLPLHHPPHHHEIGRAPPPRPPHLHLGNAPEPATPPLPPHVAPPTGLDEIPHESLTEIPVVDLRSAGAAPSGTDESPLRILQTHPGEDQTFSKPQPLDQIPEWVQRPAPGVGEHPQAFVLHSERFATAEEAQAELWHKLREMLIVDLEKTSPDARHWPPTQAQARAAGVIVQECDIAWPLQVGEFQETVHQVHWQVQLDDAARHRLAANWQPELVRGRLGRIAAAFLLASLLMVGARWSLRNRHSPAGQFS